MEKTERERIVRLIQREVVPAIGCTEPIAVALCVSQATRLLATIPEKIEVLLSANILKNAMGVGIPGTGMIGLPIAVALGALVGNPDYQLEVLKDITPDAVTRGKQFIDEERIQIALKENIAEKLYIEVTVTAATSSATAVIAGGHTTFVYEEKDGRVLRDNRKVADVETSDEDCTLSLRRVYDFALTAPLEEIEFILESARLNKAAAEQSCKGNYGHSLGKTMNSTVRPIMGDTIYTRILSYTSGACDARMAGAMIPVMSNSGSGNQGITATLPVVVYAEENHKSHEELVRALTLSHLTVIYIKQSLGRLSALCGCVVAATGSCCGITYLMGGGYVEITYAVKNMVANLTGMLCDGAKPSCAMKLTTGVSTAIFSSVLAMEHKCVTAVEGIIENDVDRTVRNLTRIGAQGMNETDRVVLDIMTHKCP